MAELLRLQVALGVRVADAVDRLGLVVHIVGVDPLGAVRGGREDELDVGAEGRLCQGPERGVLGAAVDVEPVDRDASPRARGGVRPRESHVPAERGPRGVVYHLDGSLAAALGVRLGRLLVDLVRAIGVHGPVRELDQRDVPREHRRGLDALDALELLGGRLGELEHARIIAISALLALEDVHHIVGLRGVVEVRRRLAEVGAQDAGRHEQHDRDGQRRHGYARLAAARHAGAPGKEAGHARDARGDAAGLLSVRREAVHEPASTAELAEQAAARLDVARLADRVDRAHAAGALGGRPRADEQGDHRERDHDGERAGVDAHGHGGLAADERGPAVARGGEGGVGAREADEDAERDADEPEDARLDEHGAPELPLGRAE